MFECEVVEDRNGGAGYEAESSVSGVTLVPRLSRSMITVSRTLVVTRSARISGVIGFTWFSSKRMTGSR